MKKVTAFSGNLFRGIAFAILGCGIVQLAFASENSEPHLTTTETDSGSTSIEEGLVDDNNGTENTAVPRGRQHAVSRLPSP